MSAAQATSNRLLLAAIAAAGFLLGVAGGGVLGAHLATGERAAVTPAGFQGEPLQPSATAGPAAKVEV